MVSDKYNRRGAVKRLWECLNDTRDIDFIAYRLGELASEYDMSLEPRPDAVLYRLSNSSLDPKTVVVLFVKLFGVNVVCRQTSWYLGRLMTIVDCLRLVTSSHRKTKLHECLRLLKSRGGSGAHSIGQEHLLEEYYRDCMYKTTRNDFLNEILDIDPIEYRPDDPCICTAEDLEPFL